MCVSLYPADSMCVFSGKSQVMGEIKIALKKEVKTDGEQLVLEILQCRNITYKFKSPDHLPGKSKHNTHTYCHLAWICTRSQHAGLISSSFIFLFPILSILL